MTETARELGRTALHVYDRDESAKGSLTEIIFAKLPELKTRPGWEMLDTYQGGERHGPTRTKRHWPLVPFPFGLWPLYVIELLRSLPANTVVKYWLREDGAIVVSFTNDANRVPVTFLLLASKMEYDTSLEFGRIIYWL